MTARARLSGYWMDHPLWMYSIWQICTDPVGKYGYERRHGILLLPLSVYGIASTGDTHTYNNIHNTIGHKNYTLNNKLFFFARAHCAPFYTLRVYLFFLGRRQKERELDFCHLFALFFLWHFTNRGWNFVGMRYVRIRRLEDDLAHDRMS